jgi:hypothetical protein
MFYSWWVDGAGFNDGTWDCSLRFFALAVTERRLALYE